MALLDKLRLELDRAGKTAQRAFDEGRVRLDLFRARQSADKFAQRLGYALYRARQIGGELSPEDYASHANNITAAEAEVARLQAMADQASQQRKDVLSPTAPRPSI